MLTSMIQLAVFVLCGQLLSFFRPKDSYEKYFKFIVNLMIMLLFLMPVVDFFQSGAKEEIGSWMEEFWQKMEGEAVAWNREEISVSITEVQIEEVKMEE